MSSCSSLTWLCLHLFVLYCWLMNRYDPGVRRHDGATDEAQILSEEHPDQRPSVSRWEQLFALCVQGHCWKWDATVMFWYSDVLESRPAPHVQRSHRTPGLQVQPPRRLLSSLPSHGPLGMLGKRSYHHHSRVESAERRAGAPGQGGCVLLNV